MSINTKEIYQKQGRLSVRHAPLSSDLGQFCNVKVSVTGRF